MKNIYTFKLFNTNINLFSQAPPPLLKVINAGEKKSHTNGAA